MLELTEKQTAFAREYVASGNARQAALSAGYAPSVADNAGREVLGSDAVRERVLELRRETQERVTERLAAAAERAAGTLVEIAENRDSPATARIRAAVEILDRGGFVLLSPGMAERQDDLQRFLDFSAEDA